MKHYYNMAAQTSRHYFRSQERVERGATLSLLPSSLANPPVQKKVSLAEPFRSSGGDFSLPSITRLSLLPVEALISLEGEGFMEMRVKHLQKMGEVAKAVVLAKACTECSFISNKATFHHTYVSLLCHLLPNEEAIMEVFVLERVLSGHAER